MLKSNDLIIANNNVFVFSSPEFADAYCELEQRILDSSDGLGVETTIVRSPTNPDSFYLNLELVDASQVRLPHTNLLLPIVNTKYELIARIGLTPKAKPTTHKPIYIGRATEEYADLIGDTFYTHGLNLSIWDLKPTFRTVSSLL